MVKPSMFSKFMPCNFSAFKPEGSSIILSLRVVNLEKSIVDKSESPNINSFNLDPLANLTPLTFKKPIWPRLSSCIDGGKV